ncbi:MAG: cytochrome P450 [Nocardiaceae bacterium]|nr:cytochrome P450 [Nocardiaceae bacterium]
MTTQMATTEIPGPRGLPLLGNAFDIDSHHPFESLMALCRKYGPIIKLSTPAGSRYIVSGAKLVEEVCDDTRFDKKVTGGLSNVRKGGTGNGLFTADTTDPLWSRAHNILMTPFSLQSMRDYMPMMLDIAGELCEKWERLNRDDEVDVPADMTRLTLDTIALCGFDYRFNSFYRDTQHPFIEAMVRTLATSQARAQQLPIQSKLNFRAQRQLEKDDAYMNNLVDRLIAERRAEGAAGKSDDLLGRMINGVDKATGEKLPDDNIRAQCITFLIAGHETTSGLLSFAIYYLLKNPQFMRKAREEVDKVFGTTAEPTFEQVHRLIYVRQVLSEALRLWPTAPGFTRAPFEDTVIGGKWAIPKGTPLVVLTPMLHRDKSVWGPDAEEFNPDHMAAERMAAISPNAYKPFGTGQRACIGRQFAMQEAVLVLGMLLQRFELIDHLNYQLKTKTTLTVKPDEMRIRVRPRTDQFVKLPGKMRVTAEQTGAPQPKMAAPANRHNTPLTVAFGSNLGTAEGIATKLAQEGTDRGYSVTLCSLDEIAGKPPSGALVVVAASYNGTPTDNAGKFCAWLRTAPAGSCSATQYTVFGCGSKEWASTYQAVPTMIDNELSAKGATRLQPRGEGDASADFDAAYRSWHDGLWDAIGSGLGVSADSAKPATTTTRLTMTFENRQLANPVIKSFLAQPSLVRANRELHSPSDTRSTRHIDVELPVGVSYQAGDHLGVMPRNSIDNIRRVMNHFQLDGGMFATITMEGGNYTHLPIGEPTPLLGILSSCVELQDIASREGIEVLSEHTDNDAERAELKALISDDEKYKEQVLTPRRSLLDLVEKYPSCSIPFETFLGLLPPQRPRYYSIASSPLVNAKIASIATGVLCAPSRSGAGTFNGVCSNYLANNPAGSTVFTFVRRPTIEFRPPENPHVPMIMVGAGTGLAPFLGFLQERATQREQGAPIAPSMVFFGCRHPEHDYIYGEELQEYDRLGVAKLRTVFSQQPTDGRKYVQHEIEAHADEVWEMLEKGAPWCSSAATRTPWRPECGRRS